MQMCYISQEIVSNYEVFDDVVDVVRMWYAS